MMRTSGPQRLGRDRHARDQPAAADAGDDRADVRALLQDLQPHRALPGDDVRVVERVDEDRAGALGELAAPPRARRPRCRRRTRSRRRTPWWPTTLGSGAPSGMKTVARVPSRPAASATPWAWLPALAATTPRARSSSESRAIRAYAPRTLYEPARCTFSHLSQIGTPSDRRQRPRSSPTACAHDAGEQLPGGLDVGKREQIQHPTSCPDRRTLPPAVPIRARNPQPWPTPPASAVREPSPSREHRSRHRG